MSEQTITIAVALISLVLLLVLLFFRKKRQTKLKEEIDTLPKEQEELLDTKTAELNALKDKKEEYKNKIDETFKREEAEENLNKSNQEKNTLSNKIKKLEESIKEKENEIEELEDEIRSWKNRHRQSTREKEELTEEYNKKTKEYDSKLETEIFNRKKAEEDLKKGNQAMQFLNKILEAKPTLLDENSANKQKAVANIESYIRTTYTDHLKSEDKKALEGTQHQHQREKVANRQQDFEERRTKWGILERKHWIKNKTVIAFIGQFSAGKTSIVNRILSNGDQADTVKLPVSSKATTAIPTYISYTEKFDSTFISPNDDHKAIDKETFQMVEKEMLEKVNISPLIKYFVIGYKNDNLQDLSILDTPGFSSNDQEDSERTIEVVNEADALFWVVDVNNGELNRNSIQTIQKNLKKPLYIIINKTDTKSPNEVKQVVEQIRKTATNAALKVKEIITFSHQEDPKTLIEKVKGIPKTDEGGQFLSSITKEIESNIKTAEINLQKAIKAKNRESSKLQSYIDTLDVSVYDNIDSIKKLRNLLTRTESFWGNVRFEMSLSKYGEFQDYLRGITQNTYEITTATIGTGTESDYWDKHIKRLKRKGKFEEKEGIVKTVKRLNSLEEEFLNTQNKVGSLYRMKDNWGKLVRQYEKAKTNK